MPKFTRSATAAWEGSGKNGKGTISTESTVLSKTPYSSKTRFEGEPGTNPEELVGAAHAGCFSMQLSFLLSEAGYEPDRLETEARVTFQDGTITRIHLELKGRVQKISNDEFESLAQKAKEICPISKLLDTEIDLNATLG